MWFNLEMLHTMLRVKIDENIEMIETTSQANCMHLKMEKRHTHPNPPHTNVPKNYAQFQFDKSI